MKSHPSQPVIALRSTERTRLAVLLLLGLTTMDANAYIDPNTGGLLYQILLPIIVAVTAGWRYLKLSVVHLFRTFFHRGNAQVGVNSAEQGDNDSATR